MAYNQSADVVKEVKYLNKDFASFRNQLIEFAKKHRLRLDKLDGMKFDILTNQWKLSENKSVNYIAMFKKI